MGEREPHHEVIQRGELFVLSHPGTESTFSGYGLIAQPGRKDALVGLLMVDRPRPVDPDWLHRVEEAFGEYQLAPMTATGERGILCQMHVEADSVPYLRTYPAGGAAPIQEALRPLLNQPPRPRFALQWSDDYRLWMSRIMPPNTLPSEIRRLFEKTGYGCLALEADIGIVHICHASETDIAGFADKPVISRWQLVKMPSAPLIRLELVIFDNRQEPFLFESFLNIAETDQAQVLARLANQEHLILAFYGDNLEFNYARTIPHDRQQWQQLDEISLEARRYWESLPPERRDFDRAKAAFLRHS